MNSPTMPTMCKQPLPRIIKSRPVSIPNSSGPTHKTTIRWLLPNSALTHNKTKRSIRACLWYFFFIMYSELNTGVSKPVFYGISALNFPLSAMFIAPVSYIFKRCSLRTGKQPNRHDFIVSQTSPCYLRHYAL